jgi:hypothetical protein
VSDSQKRPIEKKADKRPDLSLQKMDQSSSAKTGKYATQSPVAEARNMPVLFTSIYVGFSTDSAWRHSRLEKWIFDFVRQAT